VRDNLGAAGPERANAAKAVEAVACLGVAGSLSDAGTRRSRYPSAAGSANEVRLGVLAAIRWGYVSEEL
jgi:hypothetical protein